MIGRRLRIAEYSHFSTVTRSSKKSANIKPLKAGILKDESVFLEKDYLELKANKFVDTHKIKPFFLLIIRLAAIPFLFIYNLQVIISLL